MRIGFYSMLALALASTVLPVPAFAQSAAIDSCQSALDAPNGSENESPATETSSRFGSNIVEIDGNAITKMADLLSALNIAPGKVPLVNGGDFDGWDFRALVGGMRPVCFFETNLKNTKWDGGQLSGIGFIKTLLDGATFDKAHLDKILLREAGLSGVFMRGAVLRGGLLDGGWGGSVENWDLTGADMRGFVFQCGITIGDGCPLDRSGTKFSNVDFRGADLASYVFWGGADYRGAKIENAQIAPRQIKELIGADFGSGVHLVGGESKVWLDAGEMRALQQQIGLAEAERAKPSFDCGKVLTKVESMICDNLGRNLPGLDRRVAETYAAVRPKNPAVAISQKKWLAERNACKDGLCVGESYQKRLSQLTKMLGEPQLLKRGESALFYDEQIALSADFLNSSLFGKIRTVLFGASMGEAWLNRAADGSYSVAGDSVGANGHMCSAGGQGLRFDDGTGWFAGPSAETPSKRAAAFRAYADEIEFPGDGHPDETEFPGSEDYASCGMRGVLGPFKRIELDAAEMEKRRAAMMKIIE